VSRRKAQGPSVSFFAFQDIITSVVGIFVLITLIMMVDLVTKTSSSAKVREAFEDIYTAAIDDLQEQLAKLETRSAQLDVAATKLGNVQVFNKDEIAKELEASIQSLNQQVERVERRNQEIQRVIEGQDKVKSELQIEVEKRSPDREELERLLKQLEKLDSKIQSLQTDEPLVFKSQDLQGRTIVIIEVHANKLVLLDLAKDSRSEISGGALDGKFRSWLSSRNVGSIHCFVLIRPYAAGTFGSVRAVLDATGASYGYDLIDKKRSVKLRSEVGN
jgi:vacuolar-type H+-ATPase subunit I/STV1